MGYTPGFRRPGLCFDWLCSGGGVALAQHRRINPSLFAFYSPYYRLVERLKVALAATFGVLFLLAVYTLVASFKAGVDGVDITAQVGTVIGLAVAFLGLLTQNSLKTYLFWQRAKLLFNAGSISRLTLVSRFDGNFGDRKLNELVTFLTDGQQFRNPAQVRHLGAQTTFLYTHSGLNLTLSSESKSLSFDALAHIQVSISKLELPTRYSVKKLDEQILPLLSSIRQFLGVGNSAFELELSFEEGNPFFSIYIAHLRPEQIDDFHVVLTLPSSQPERDDRIDIRKQSLSISASSVENLAKLAHDFILLTPNLQSVIKGTHV